MRGKKYFAGIESFIFVSLLRGRVIVEIYIVRWRRGDENC